MRADARARSARRRGGGRRQRSAPLHVRRRHVAAGRRLRDAGVPKDKLEMLARDAMLQQRLLVNNPREVTEADALAIYNQAY